MSSADARAFRRWCSRVAALVAAGTPFRRAIHVADVADALDREVERCAIHPARVSSGGRA